MTDQETLWPRTDGRSAPKWACRARELGEDIAFVVEGWSNVPKPLPKVVPCVGGCLWTWSQGPPELVERVLSLLGS